MLGRARRLRIQRRRARVLSNTGLFAGFDKLRKRFHGVRCLERAHTRPWPNCVAFGDGVTLLREVDRMNVSYRHTQVGYLMIGVLLAGAACISAALVFGHGPHALVFAVGVLGLCLLLFPTLTAVVQGDTVRCFFGFGLIRRAIPVQDILSVSVVQNPWIYGFGLRSIPGGWLWNVSTGDAVELRLRSGKRFRIGSDDASVLREAIANASRTG